MNKYSSDFELLAIAANYIKHDFERDNNDWKESPFEWVLSIPPGSKGKLGRQLIYQWCALKGLSVDKSPDSEADMLINGHRIEVKFSTLWKAGFYKFQQIRDQNYEFLICLGVSPNEAHCWIVSKNLLKRVVIGHMGQHTGSTGRDTAWFPVSPANIPDWLLPYGGSLDDAYTYLKNLRRI